MLKLDPAHIVRELVVNGERYAYCSLSALASQGLPRVERLPYTMKVVVESVLRQQLEERAEPEAWDALQHWLFTGEPGAEIGFTPARVLMVEASGIPLLADLAAMRDAMVDLGGDPSRINPAVPVDFIIDHSIAVDHSGTPDALRANLRLEFERNAERYAFIRWGAQAFRNIRVIPPGAGICHQVNLEHLARVVWCDEVAGRRMLYPDSVLGIDSHTPMVNSIGVVGWGVGGLEGGSAALGEPVSMVIPEVVGCRLTGKPRAGVTATDIVLTVTQVLRGENLVGSFVEYTGSGVAMLDAADRSTIANMTPETGATMGFFPVDAETLRYLRLTGRDAHQIELVEAYSRAQGLWREADAPEPEYARYIEIDMASIEPCVAGPNRPHQRLPLSQVPASFRVAYPPRPDLHGSLCDGDVVIAAITSCTNTSNPSSMICAGLLARNAVNRGLKVPHWVKTSLSPGSRVVPEYLQQGSLMEPLQSLGFHIAGFGCMTCIGNSGPLQAAVERAIESDDLAVSAVLSGNRNFEGRVHPLTRANFLASPALVVAYALAGTVLKDLAHDPLGQDAHGNDVFLRDVWPADEEIRALKDATVTPSLFRAQYQDIEKGTSEWRDIRIQAGPTFKWDTASTYIRRPPFFDRATERPPEPVGLRGARVLAMFGDMLTTDHISPIGAISSGTPAAAYLESLGVAARDFQSYGSRRANHDVMRRGTFANIRIRNEMTPEAEGGYTRQMPSGRMATIFDAAESYAAAAVPLVVIAGSSYGAGSSRDWAAKGAKLLGVKAVIAESFERIHRSNLVGIGIVPLQFMANEGRKSLALDGSERLDIDGLGGTIVPGMTLACTITRADGRQLQIRLKVRLDTDREVEYHRHGGILLHALRQRLH